MGDMVIQAATLRPASFAAPLRHSVTAPQSFAEALPMSPWPGTKHKVCNVHQSGPDGTNNSQLNLSWALFYLNSIDKM